MKWEEMVNMGGWIRKREKKGGREKEQNKKREKMETRLLWMGRRDIWEEEQANKKKTSYVMCRFPTMSVVTVCIWSLPADLIKETNKRTKFFLLCFGETPKRLRLRSPSSLDSEHIPYLHCWRLQVFQTLRCLHNFNGSVLLIKMRDFLNVTSMLEKFWCTLLHCYSNSQGACLITRARCPFLLSVVFLTRVR